MIHRREVEPMPSGFRRPGAWAVGLVLAALMGCNQTPEYRRYGGETMGTYYRVTARCPGDVSQLIVDELTSVNDQMSTYLPASTLSQFNSAPPGSWFPVTEQLAEVVSAALVLSRESEGAFDVTVGPLVNLWGFGPEDADQVPSPEAVAAARQRVGYESLEVEVEVDPPRLRKHADLYVDLSAIAKGYGVDRVSGRLADAGCDASLVDIGGEVKGTGSSPANGPWRIGIEVPDPTRRGAVQRVIRLQDGAAATSGDYRNFLVEGGQRYSHTVDPRTGYPVQHGLASVTVLHPSAMWADGYATLLTVLGPDEGLDFARRHGLAVMLIVRGENGLEERYTDAFESVLID